VATAVEGTLKLTLRISRGLRVSFDVSASSTHVAHVTGSGTLAPSTTVGGSRAYTVRATELKGRASFPLAVSKPSRPLNLTRHHARDEAPRPRPRPRSAPS